MSKGKKNKRKRPGRGRQAPERAEVPKPKTGGLHFTIGTGPSFDETTR